MIQATEGMRLRAGLRSDEGLPLPLPGPTATRSAQNELACSTGIESIDAHDGSGDRLEIETLQAVQQLGARGIDTARPKRSPADT